MKGEEENIYKLKKTLYGLKQAPHVWYGKIDAYFTDKRFRRSPSDPTFYVKHDKIGMLIVSFYVDDLIFTENDEKNMRLTIWIYFIIIEYWNWSKKRWCFYFSKEVCWKYSLQV